MNRVSRGDVLDAMDVAVAVLNQDGIIVDANHAWRRFSLDNGGPADGYLGADYVASFDMDLEAGLAPLARDMRALLAGDLPSLDHEYPCDSPHERRWFLMKVRPFESEGTRWATVMHVQIPQPSIAAPEGPQQRQLRDKLLRLVGHQFRTPLTPLRFDAELLRKQLPDLAPTIDRLVRNVSRLERMVESSVDLLRLERGVLVQRQGRPARTALEQAVDDAVHELKLADRVHVSSSGDDNTMHMDMSWMGRAIQELLRNAARFGTERIDVRIEVDQNATIQVADDGQGFDGGQLDIRAFEVNDDAESTLAGVGLGLALAAEVARVHRGTLIVTSPGKGKGTVATLQLPLATNA